MNDDRAITEAESFQARKDGTDALIDHRDKPEISLFDASIFLRGDPEEKLFRQALSIQHRFRLLPFSHEPIAQRNIVNLWQCGRNIEIYLTERMFIIERAIVGRVRLHKSNHKNERIAAMLFDKFACVLFKELWPR